MPRIARTVCSIALSLGCTGVCASPPPPPLDAFARIPVESSAVLSPDGHWLARLDRKEAEPRVVILDLEARKTQRVLAVPENARLDRLFFADNETLLVTVSPTQDFAADRQTPTQSTLTLAEDVSGGDPRVLPKSHERFQSYASLVLARPSRPKTVLMVSDTLCRQSNDSCLIEVDTRTGESTPVAFATQLTTQWAVTWAGRAIAREDWDPAHHQYRVLSLTAGAAPKEIYRGEDGEHPHLGGLLSDQSALVLLAARGRPKQAAWALPLDGSALRLLAEDPNDDIVASVTDSLTGALVGLRVGGSDGGSVRWLDPTAQERFDKVQKTFPRQRVDIDGWSADGQRILVRADSASNPPVYYIVDLKTHRAEIAAEEYPGLAGVRLGTQREVPYTARDGTTIPAYLTLPPDPPQGPLPLVVLPHDQPRSRDFPTFNWLVQFLASRGYAVLQPQFRGSTGFGAAFREAGLRQWGRLMQDDVTDGVKAMVEQGIADAKHVCIVGEGYAGYVALAGAAFTPRLYTCAASINGSADLPKLIRETLPLTPDARSAALEYWKSQVGSLHDDVLARTSPINFARAFRAPVLLVYEQGAEAQVQSEAMAKALRRAEKDVTTLKLPAGNAWRATSESRTLVLRELERFLESYL